ncbi:MAG: hypothetical protein ABJI96_05635 [Paracoccaceae bacterium]
MPLTKPRYMLIEHGRYFYQRKVPLALQSVIGRKKWRAPLGDDFDQAYERLKSKRSEHDALLKRLEDPVEKQKHKTQNRLKIEQKQNEDYVRDEDAYEEWCLLQSIKTETEEYLEEEKVLLAGGLIEELRAVEIVFYYSGANSGKTGLPVVPFFVGNLTK